MTTAVTQQKIQLPAHLQGLAGKYTGGGAAGGIRSASYPRVSVDGGKFFLVKEGQKQLINDPTNPAVPLMQFNTVVVGWSPTLTKTYYEGEYAAGDQKEPTCSSEDGITPDEHIDIPQHPTCNGCPMNEWGSAISKFSHKKTKACEDSKRIAIIPSIDLSFFAMGLSIKPASLKNWSDYVKQLEGMGVALWMVETQITFDYTVSFPKLKFAMTRFLAEHELEALTKRGELSKQGLISEEINGIVRPRGNLPTTPAAAVPATAPSAAPAAPAVRPIEAAPVVAPTPAPAPAPVAKPAPAPAAAGFSFGAPAAPAAPAPAPVMPTPPAPVQQPLWSDGLPDAVVAGVNAVGGPESDMGKQLLAMASAQPAAKQPAEAKAPKRTKPAAPAAPPAPPPAPSPAPASPAPAAIAFPTAPVAGQSPSAPAPAVSAAPGMAMNLADMLKNVLGS
jgi:hypothetical protein